MEDTDGTVYGPGNGTIWLGEVNCVGNETHLEACENDGWGPVTYCDHEEDAGVMCCEYNKPLV